MKQVILFILSTSLLNATHSYSGMVYSSSGCPDYYYVTTTDIMRESTVTSQVATPRCDESAGYFAQGERLHWIRLNGLGGNGIINQKPKSIGICGTTHPGWIQAKLPKPFGMTTGKLCYYTPSTGYTCPNNQHCSDYLEVDIFNCKGKFFLYQFHPRSLNPITDCAKAFCTTDVGLCELQTYTIVRTLPEMTVNYRTTSASGEMPRSLNGAYYLNGETWIRLQGTGGTEIITEKPSDSNVCGTQRPGWITGSIPSAPGSEVQSELCFSKEPEVGTCTDGHRIDIMNCHNFMLYRLHTSPSQRASAFCTHKPAYDVCDPKSYVNVTAQGIWSERAYKPRSTRRSDDQYADGKTWMKFLGADGPQVITTTKPQHTGRCDVDNPGWMEGNIPRKNVRVRRKLCYYDGTETVCPHAREIDVVNCGSFLLYRFHEVSASIDSAAFCTDFLSPGPCYYRPCLHGGECVQNGACYRCNCPAGASGKNCENDDIDECDSQPCQNGGTCSDDFGGYNCTCRPGFTGVNCDTEIDNCRPNPCHNGGTCVNIGDGYECRCPTGYTGDSCETEVTDNDECSPNPCKHYGNCIDGVNAFTCECKFGWSGDTCEDDTDIETAIDVIVRNYDTYGGSSEEGREGGGGGFFNWLAGLFGAIGGALGSLFGPLGSLFGSLGNAANAGNSLRDFNKNNRPRNPRYRCGRMNLGSGLQGLRSGNERCTRKYENRECSIREKAKPGKKNRESIEPETTEPTEAPEESQTTEEPSSCTATCSAVQNPDHGARIGDKTSCGDSVSFSCDQGYKLQDCAEPQCKITCQHDGQWSNLAPKCVETTCGGLVTLSASRPQRKIEKMASSDHTDCSWAVASEKSSDILLRFLIFEMLDSVSRQHECQDYVEIIVGTRRDRFCGGKPDEVTINNAGVIKFHSSSSSSHLKIKLSLQVGCGSSPNLFRRTGSACKPCTVNAHRPDQWPSISPLLTSKNVVKLPDYRGMLRLADGDRITAQCINSKFNNYHVDTVKLKCLNGKFFVVVSNAKGGTNTHSLKKFKDFKCKALPKPVFWKNGMGLNIGWEKNVITQMVIVYDNARKIPDYVEHTIDGSSISWNEGGTRPTFKVTKVAGFQEVAPDSYTKLNQYTKLENIQAGLGTKYIDCCDANYLVRGHLAPNADFSLRSWRDATFYMVNVAPQWQGINAGNWLALENAIRGYASQRAEAIKIITGTHGTLTLDTHNIYFPEPATPVPSHFWKVVHDTAKKAAVAFVILNNPYAVPNATDGLPNGNDKLCTSQCDFLNNLGKHQTPAKGMLMCCSVDELSDQIRTIPALGAAVTDLFVSTDKAAEDFGQYLKTNVR